MRHNETDPPLRAVLFDFDGTLADSYPAITASINNVRAFHGLAPLPEGEVRPHVGRGPEYLIRHTIPGIDPAAGLARYRAHHPSVMRTGTRLLPGAGEALASLTKAGILVAICSNKPRRFTEQLLEHLGLAPHIDAVFGPEDVPRPKPAPDMLRAALARLGVQPNQGLFVGDMTVDIETARQAGVRVWVVPTGSDERHVLAAAAPDRILDDLHQLTELLRE
jgi:phosphoglycolate phosphatase